MEVVRCIGLACGPVGRRSPGYRVRACDTSLRGNASDSHDRLSNGVKTNPDIGCPPAKLLGGDCTSASEYEAPRHLHAMGSFHVVHGVADDIRLGAVDCMI